jgi:type IV pilus assembly protein PilX
MKTTPITRREQGSVLIIGLVVLILMLMLGAVAIRATALQERMAGSFTEQNHAFQGAEMALRVGESRITDGTINGSGCFYSVNGAPAPLDENSSYADWAAETNLCVLGASYYRSGFAADTPRFFVEQQQDRPDTSLEAGSVSTKPVYKITAMGAGGVKNLAGDPAITVILQASVTQ